MRKCVGKLIKSEIQTLTTSHLHILVIAEEAIIINTTWHGLMISEKLLNAQ